MILTAEQYKAYRRDPSTYPETIDPECQEIANLMVGLCDDGWWCGWMDGIVEILFDYLTHPDKELPDSLHIPEDEWRRDLESLRALTLDQGRWVHEDNEGTIFVIPAPVLGQPALDVEFLCRQHDFSQRTFGPGRRTVNVLDHIRSELTEIEETPNDVSEWADVVLLALDGALRAGHSPQDILDAILSKAQRNRERSWPDWRTAAPDTRIEHIR